MFYHCKSCNKTTCVFDRRISIGPWEPRPSFPCPECGDDMALVLFGEHKNHEDVLASSWLGQV